MPEYRLSGAAKKDLIEIAQYGDLNWGVEQSNEYRAKLKNQFVRLSEQPYLYQAVDHIHPDYRRSVCGSHSIYYRVDDDGIEIMRDSGIGEQEIAQFVWSRLGPPLAELGKHQDTGLIESADWNHNEIDLK